MSTLGGVFQICYPFLGPVFKILSILGHNFFFHLFALGPLKWGFFSLGCGGVEGVLIS